jgi:ABC-2 type transport system ATP-binding protein
MIGLLGPNGAGKTTISMILGVLEPTYGHISISGLDLTSKREAALRKANFSAAYTPLPGNLTVVESLRVFGLIYGGSGT